MDILSRKKTSISCGIWETVLKVINEQYYQRLLAEVMALLPTGIMLFILRFLFEITAYFGAEGLVRGSSSLALRLGVSPLGIRLMVVAYGTSMPELVVSIKAALVHQGAVSIIAPNRNIKPRNVNFLVQRFYSSLAP